MTMTGLSKVVCDSCPKIDISVIPGGCVGNLFRVDAGDLDIGSSTTAMTVLPKIFKSQRSGGAQSRANGMEAGQWIIIGVAMVGSAIIKNGIGIGAGIFMLPFLAMVLPSKLALGIGAPAMLISDIVGLKTYWGEWDAEELKRLVPTGIAGVMLGGYLINIIPASWFRLGIGIIAVCFAAFQLFGPMLKRLRTIPTEVKDSNELPGRSFGAWIFGFLGGVASTIAHAGGVVLSIYMLKTQENKRRFVGTFIFFFAITNLMKLLTYIKIGILTSDVAVWVGILSPLIIFGGFLGNALNKRISKATFRNVVLIIILVIGARIAWTE